ncbi:hypothetical protein D3C81_919390 [compost metagenome]
MADLVPDHAAHLVVAEEVHQPAVHAHAPVGHGPRVDVLGHVDLGIERQPGVAQPAHHIREPLGVGAVGRRNGVLLVHFRARLVGQCLDAGVRQRGRGEQAAAGLGQVFHIGAGAAGQQGGAGKGG